MFRFDTGMQGFGYTEGFALLADCAKNLQQDLLFVPVSSGETLNPIP